MQRGCPPRLRLFATHHGKAGGRRHSRSASTGLDQKWKDLEETTIWNDRSRKGATRRPPQRRQPRCRAARSPTQSSTAADMQQLPARRCGMRGTVSPAMPRRSRASDPRHRRGRVVLVADTRLELVTIGPAHRRECLRLLWSGGLSRRTIDRSANLSCRSTSTAE